APSCPGVGLRAPTDHTANARGIVVTVDGPKPTDTQRHREGRGENGKQRTTAAPVRAHHESSAGKHHITAAHQSKEFLGRRFADAANSAAQRAIRPSFPAASVNRPPSFRVRGRREFEGDRKPTRILLAGAVVPFYGAVLASTE